MDFIYIILIFLILGLIGIVIYIIIDNKQYKHLVEIRELSKGRKLLYHDKAKEYRGADGGNFWKLKKEKDSVKRYLSVPPDEAIELNSKGKKCVTIYRDDTGSYLYQVDNTSSLGSEQEIQPLKTSHRITMIDNFKKANERNPMSFLKQHGLALGFGLLVVILIIGILSFWGEIGKPLVSIYKEKNAYADTMLQVLEKIDDMNRNVQRITGVEGLNDTIPDTPPN